MKKKFKTICFFSVIDFTQDKSPEINKNKNK